MSEPTAARFMPACWSVSANAISTFPLRVPPSGTLGAGKFALGSNSRSTVGASDPLSIQTCVGVQPDAATAASATGAALSQTA